MPAQPTGPSRHVPIEVAELTRLKTEQPDLAPAVDLQLELLSLHRRVQGRVPLPSLKINAEDARARQVAGRPLLQFDQIPFNWSDVRYLLRETAALLRRHDAIEEGDLRRAEALARSPESLDAVLERWFRATADRTAAEAPAGDGALEGGLDNVVTLALRPFLTRCAEAMLASVDLSSWTARYCPICGGEAEFATITPSADRLLLCSRCTARWRYDPLACPYCGNGDRSRITSFATRDGAYRIYACDECKRYLKAYDGRHASRPVLVPVDSVATLPLDAAAMQRGYRS